MDEDNEGAPQEDHSDTVVASVAQVYAAGNKDVVNERKTSEIDAVAECESD